MKSIEKKINDITITIDFKTELLGIIMLLSNYKNKFPELFKDYENKFYVDNIMNQFNKYKDDEIIKEFDEIVNKHSFTYDAPFCLFLQLNNNLKVNKLDNYVFKTRLHNDEKIYEFIDKLNRFAEKIKFINYYKKNSNLYKEMINNISKTFQKNDILKFLKDYYGYKIDKEFVVNLIPFTTDGSYCCNLKNKIISCFPIFAYMKKEKLYDSNNCEKQIIQNLIHEFSHSYVNSITEEQNILKNNTKFFDNIEEQMKKIGYSNDIQIINEHIIRAIEARFIKLIYNDDEWYQKRIEKDYHMGFIYIKNIVDSLIIYENNRTTYPTLNDFYPEIIKNIITTKNNAN